MFGRRYTCEAYKDEQRHLFKINISKLQPVSCQWWIPHCLKQAEVIPVFENKEKLDKSNNRPINFLPVISKIYERLMYDQMFNILIKSSLNFNLVFVNDLALWNCFLCMIKNWKEFLDQGGHYCALLTDLPKGFDCMMHNLLIVKLQAYGFDNDF